MKMKRLVCLVLVVVFVFALAACGGSSKLIPEKCDYALYIYFNTNGMPAFVGFYPDKTVMVSSVDCAYTEEDIRQVVTWYTAESSVSVGEYAMQGENIEFSIYSTAGQVDFTGVFNNGIITFDSYSHINGNQRTDTEMHYVGAVTNGEIKFVNGLQFDS